MGNVLIALEGIKKQTPTGYWSDRIIAEMEYACRVSKVKGNRYDDVIGSAIQHLEAMLAEDGTITKAAALEAENRLSGLAGDAKSFSMICAAHAHIDMNWMWSWDETVSITIDTFRTMLDLMNEYPEYKFSQSQASIYSIIEEYAPEMLLEIKKRVKEGRWEVTASHWVEADKNMPAGESFSRHLLYTRRYLSQLLDIIPETLNIDFEPDTFGHSLNVPEILAEGGVKYYYHCRGYEGHNLYRWRAPSGSAVTVYREPIWYNATIEPSMAAYVPEFCTTNGMNTMLKVYGVGDHGGGPTRRDLERLRDMNQWPIFPNIRCGTFAEFYAMVEPIADKLPLVEGELNYVFTGCYTSQSRIKMANRIGEATLNEAEAWSAISSIAAHTHYPSQSYEKAWRNVLFNQFHDILPGSGVIDTREHAMGLFQNTMAAANSNRSLALRNIAALVNTSAYISDEDLKETYSEGAGVGYGIKEFKVAQIDRGKGKSRIFNFFNTSAYDREEVAEIIIWDWKGDLKCIEFKDCNGDAVQHQVLDHGFNHYWGHDFVRVLVNVRVPAYGYSTYIFTEKLVEPKLQFQLDPRVDKVKSDQFVLENELLKVTFHPVNGSIQSMIDKTNGEEMIDRSRPAAIFRYIHEDTNRGMSAWWVGRYMRIDNLHENNVVLKKVLDESSPLRQAISYEISFGRSKLKAIISLDAKSSLLDFDVECDWHEIGSMGAQIPQLNFFMPVAYKCEIYKYDIPFGTIDRKAVEMDVPANSWGLALRGEANKKSVKLITRSKYGFRGVDNSLSITLLRSSFDPDPHPEQGIHRFKLALALVNPSDNLTHIEHSYRYNHPIQVLSASAQHGTQPLVNSFAAIEQGNVAISGLKQPESSVDGKPAASQWVVRVYETEGSKTKVVLRFAQPPKQAHFVDLHEQPIKHGNPIAINGNRLSFEVAASKIANICVQF